MNYTDDICVAFVCEGLERLAEDNTDMQVVKIVKALHAKLCLENTEWEDLQTTLGNRELYTLCYHGVKRLYDNTEENVNKYILYEMMLEMQTWMQSK